MNENERDERDEREDQADQEYNAARADDTSRPGDEVVAPAAAGRRNGLVLLALGLVAVSVGYWAGRAVRGGGGGDMTQVAPAPTLDLTAGQPAHPLVGLPAPDFALTRLDTGETVTLADFAGQPILINFWATWCPPCRFEMPWLQAAHETHAGDGLVVLGVNAGERVATEFESSTIANYVSSAGLTFPILHGSGSGAMQADYAVWGLPASFMIDRDGRVASAQVGMYPSAQALEAYVAAIVR